jgi:anti-anti-sigma factor
MMFEVLDGGDCPVLRLVGELDADTVPGLEAAVAPIVSGRPPRLAIDVSRVEFVDSSAIALWVRWSNLVGRLEIHDPLPTVRANLVRLGLAQRLLLIPDRLPSSATPAGSPGAVVAINPPVSAVHGGPDAGGGESR